MNIIKGFLIKELLLAQPNFQKRILNHYLSCSYFCFLAKKTVLLKLEFYCPNSLFASSYFILSISDDIPSNIVYISTTFS